MEYDLINQEALSPNKNPFSDQKHDTLPSDTTPPKKTKFNLKEFKFPKDPKVIALVGLVSILLILLILAGIVTIARNARRPQIGSSLPTPTPQEFSTPTPSESRLPAEYQSKFSEIEKAIQTNPDLIPPLIDIETGN